MKAYNLAVVGATGMVGRTIIELLEERNIPFKDIRFLASKRSAGQTVSFKGQDYKVEELREDSFKDVDYAFFAAGGAISEAYANAATGAGAVVIDNSSVFRMHKDVPLVVPEVNPEDIKGHKGIIANPNCSTTQAVVPLRDLHSKYNIKRIVYSTYQSVSGSGVDALDDLRNSTKNFYPHKIAGNLIPHIDLFEDNGYTKEEMKMIHETKKILADDKIRITATAVRVPVEYSHALSINLEFEEAFEIEDIRKTLENTQGVVVMDEPEKNLYPLPIDIKGKDEVYVGRIRRDFSLDNGLNLWVVADNIRKGAATNAVQILELLIRD